MRCSTETFQRSGIYIILLVLLLVLKMSCDKAELMDVNGCGSSDAELSQNTQLVEMGQSQDAADQPAVECGLSTLMEVTKFSGEPAPLLANTISDVKPETVKSNTETENLYPTEENHEAKFINSCITDSEVKSCLVNVAAGSLCNNENDACSHDGNLQELKAESHCVGDDSLDSAVDEHLSAHVASSPGQTPCTDNESKMTELDCGNCCIKSACISEATHKPGTVEGENDRVQIPVEVSATGTVLQESSTSDLQTVGDIDTAVSADPMMGFTFNEEGQLRDQDGKPFEFNVSDDNWKNQRRYEQLGEAITEKIYELLVSRCKLRRMNLPLNAKDDEPHSFIFMSDGVMTTFDRLMLLIHGSGVVRAGQWARRLILNDDLYKGTQIPYIEEALREGYEVIVFNTNLNSWPDYDTDFESTSIPENDSPEAHATYVWENIIRHCHAKHIAIVAHSYGGVVTTHLLETKIEDFEKRVFAVAFTDSVHSCYHSPQQVRDFYNQRARNYVASAQPVGEPVLSYYGDEVDDAKRVSAGHTKHEWTSHTSFSAIFEYFENEYQRRLIASNDDNHSVRCTAV